jgi:hypothetical protein
MASFKWFCLKIMHSGLHQTTFEPNLESVTASRSHLNCGRLKGICSWGNQSAAVTAVCNCTNRVNSHYQEIMSTYSFCLMVWEFLMDGQDFIRMVFSRLPSSCLPWFLIQQLVRVVSNPTYATNTYSSAAAASNAAFPPRASASTSSWEMIDHLVHNLRWLANFNTWQTFEFHNNIISLFPSPTKISR